MEPILLIIPSSNLFLEPTSTEQQSYLLKETTGIIVFPTYLPIGKLFLTIRWAPRVYSMSTVMGAEYVISRKRH